MEQSILYIKMFEFELRMRNLEGSELHHSVCWTCRGGVSLWEPLSCWWSLSKSPGGMDIWGLSKLQRVLKNHIKISTITLCIKKHQWRRKWQSTPVPLPGKSHGQRSLLGYSPWGHRESDTTEWLHFLFSLCKIKEQVRHCWIKRDIVNRRNYLEHHLKGQRCKIKNYTKKKKKHQVFRIYNEWIYNRRQLGFLRIYLLLFLHTEGTSNI